MIFCGDIALPNNSIKFEVPEEIRSKSWVANLEGSLIDGNKEEGKGVYNDCDSVKELLANVSFKGFGIANNHLLDSASVSTTIMNARSLGVPTFGAGKNLNESRKPVVVQDYNGSSFRLLAFGWECIDCVLAKQQRQGVSPYSKKNVLSSVEEALKHEEPVICFIHWNYELEKYPQPYDRQFAMDLIDMGVSAVIGCHAHRVQPVEFYKGRPIVYGLGNFLFCQGHYFDGKLKFPKFCEEEYVFEIANGGRRFGLHHFRYDLVENKLEYVKSETITPETEFDGKAEFTGYSATEYGRWFKKHRVQKKLLPIFHAHESTISYALKSGWIKIRGRLINLLTKINLKSANRADRK